MDSRYTRKEESCLQYILNNFKTAYLVNQASTQLVRIQGLNTYDHDIREKTIGYHKSLQEILLKNIYLKAYINGKLFKALFKYLKFHLSHLAFQNYKLIPTFVLYIWHCQLIFHSQ